MSPFFTKIDDLLILSELTITKVKRFVYIITLKSSIIAMALNLKQYRLNTLADVKAYKKAGGDEFVTYYKAMKAFLDKLPYGSSFDILKNIPEKNLEKFVKTACVYMTEQAFDEVLFTDDYLFIKRQRVF